MSIEERLRNAPLTEPSRYLDRSVEEIIRWAEISDSVGGHRRRSYWLAFASLAAGLVIGVLVGLSLHQAGVVVGKPTPTVYIIEPTPELERWIKTQGTQAEASFFERKHGELETVLVPTEMEKNPSNEL